MEIRNNGIINEISNNFWKTELKCRQKIHQIPYRRIKFDQIASNLIKFESNSKWFKARFWYVTENSDVQKR